MKQVTLQEFMQLPEGTIFQFYTEEAKCVGLLLLYKVEAAKYDAAKYKNVIARQLVTTDHFEYIPDEDCELEEGEDMPMTRSHRFNARYEPNELFQNHQISSKDLIFVWDLLDIVHLKETLTKAVIEYPENANK